MNNSMDPIQQVRQIIKNAFDITAGHSMSPEVMQKLDDLVQQLRDCAGTKHRPTNEEECAFHFGIAIVLSLKCYCAIELLGRKDACGGPEDAFRYGLESVKLCQRVRDIVGDAGSKTLSKKLKTDLDSLEANTLNEVGFLVLQSGNPEAAIEHMQRAVYLEPRNQKFHSNYAFCLTQVEQKQPQRDLVRCQEICDHVSAALQQGPYPGVASVLEEVLRLPGLAHDVKMHAGQLQQKLVAQQRSYTDEIAIYLHSLQRLSGRIIPFRLVEAQVRPIGHYHPRVESPLFSHQLPCLALRYLATEHLANHELERAVTLLGLAIECHLGIIGERANVLLTSELPLPHPEELTGPNWLSGSSRVLAVRGCWVLHAAEAKASELQVIIGQLRVDEEMVQDQIWVDSYKVLLLGLMSAAQGTMAVVRVGDSQPFVIKAGTPGILAATAAKDGEEPFRDPVNKERTTMTTNQHIEAGKRYAASGRTNEALHHFKTAVDREPRSFMANYSMAACLAMKENYKEALKYYDKALDINPTDLETQMERETCYAHVALGKGGVDFVRKVANEVERGGDRSDSPGGLRMIPVQTGRVADKLERGRKKWWQFWK